MLIVKKNTLIRRIRRLNMDENTKPAIDDIDGGLTEEERDKHMVCILNFCILNVYMFE